jgi:hypothetical protein
MTAACHLAAAAAASAAAVAEHAHVVTQRMLHVPMARQGLQGLSEKLLVL